MTMRVALQRNEGDVCSQFTRCSRKNMKDMMVIAGGRSGRGMPLANMVVFIVGLLVHNGVVMISLWAQRAKQA